MSKLCFLMVVLSVVLSVALLMLLVVSFSVSISVSAFALVQITESAVVVPHNIVNYIDSRPEGYEEETKEWYVWLLSPDDQGILHNMSLKMREWEEKESYIDRWNLSSVEGRKLPSTKDKSRYLTKNGLRFIDKKINYQMKKAKKNSVIHKISTVRESLVSVQNFEIYSKFKIKIKAELLRGRAKLFFYNPYVDWYIEFYAYSRNRMIMFLARDFGDVVFNTTLFYGSSNARLVATIDKNITDNISSRISFVRPLDNSGSLVSSEERVEVIIKKTF
ncbi:MAG: hypothetical protein HQK53_07100 [Oligoflexia bacterium]|nr:hypothetical protein [Oligoflexia bacterium]